MLLLKNREIGTIGTISRLLIAPFFLYWGFDSPIVNLPFYWYQILLGLIGIPFMVWVFQRVRLLFTDQQLQATGFLGTLLNLLFLAILFNVHVLHNATFFYLGFSMLLAAIIGYAGCETMAVSNLVSGRRDEVGCVLFSAFDFIEGKGCHAKQSFWSSGLLASLGIIGCASFPLIAFLIEARGRENWLKYLPIVVIGIVILMLVVLIRQYRFRKQLR